MGSHGSLGNVGITTLDHLRIEKKNGTEKIVRVAASTRPEDVGAVDLIINFVKCYHTVAAMRAALPLFRDDTTILSLQNGRGNAERISEIVGHQRLLVSLTYHSAMLLAPGQNRHPGTGITYVGELGGRITPRLTAVVDALRSAGFEVSESSRILDEVWKKLALNACTLPTAALLGFCAHRLTQHAGTRELMRGLLAEVAQVARAQAIQFDENERWEAITGLLERAVGAKGSMVQDVQAKRPTEIDVIDGAIAAAGHRLGIATPLNESMVWMLKSLEESYLDWAST